MSLDPLWLSRVQFGLTAMFHYLYPPLSIGLGVALVMMEGLWLKTGDELWHHMARFWTKVFALTFSLGVATGIVMEFEFGTNWSSYSRFVGDVFGSALAAEGIFAFFLESGFLAVLLFGWDRVPRWTHFLATCLVSAGAHFSAVWIVVANSWQHTPTGHHVVQGPLGMRAEIVNFWAMVFNPSSMPRLSHVLGGAWLAGATLLLSVSAWYLLKQRHQRFALRTISVGLVLGLCASLWQLGTGHLSAQGVARTQPAKLAAFEGHFPSSAPAPLFLGGWVDEAAGTTRGPAIPGGLSLMVHGSVDAPVTGLDAFSKEDRPPVQPVFQSYHAMVAIGMALIGLMSFAALQQLRRRLPRTRWLLWALVVSVLLPQAANQLGWFSAEVGRQPWVVQGILRTKDAVSPRLHGAEVLTSLILFGIIYLGLFTLFLFLLDQKIKHGPEGDDGQLEKGAILGLRARAEG
jgi:cytochrome d ubiquinol oxidase subunit I